MSAVYDHRTVAGRAAIEAKMAKLSAIAENRRTLADAQRLARVIIDELEHGVRETRRAAPVLVETCRESMLLPYAKQLEAAIAAIEVA